MSWETFQQDAFSITRLEVKKLSRQVLTEYRLAIKSINAQLTKVYANTLSGVEPGDYYNEMIKKDRLTNLLKQLKSDYTAFATKAGIYTKNAISLSFSNTYYRKAYGLEWLVPNAQLGVLPPSLIELTTLGTNEAWGSITKSVQSNYGNKIGYMPRKGTLSSLLNANKTNELGRIQSALTQGFIGGNSKNKTMQTIMNIIGTETTKNGILQLSGAKANAQRIIRTETNRTANMGSYAQTKFASEQGTDLKRRMIAVLDTKTRAQSSSMDGQTRGVDEPFTYPNGIRAMTPGTTGNPAYDANDREGVIDIVEDMEPTIRLGRNPVTGKNEVFGYKDYNKWAEDNNLTPNKYGQWGV